MIKLILSFVVVMLSLPGYSEPLISLSGSVLSGLSLYDQSTSKSFNGQFDTAANLNVDVEFSRNVSVMTELNVGGAENMTGFTDGMALGGILVTIIPSNEISLIGERYTHILLGNKTIPFGQFAEDQTNNASLSSQFMFNDLGYAFLSNGSNVKSFSATGAGLSLQVGPKAHFAEDDIPNVDIMVFNGVNNLDSNEDQGFGVALRVKTPELPSQTVVGMSYLAANELRKSDTHTKANIQALMIDATTSVAKFDFGGYLMINHFNDGNSHTKDTATILMGQVSRNIDRLTFSGRYSIYRPEHYTGNGGGSRAFPKNVGFATLTSGDVEITRVQLSAMLELEKDVRFHNEVLFDTYGENREQYDTVGFLSYVSVDF